MAMRLQEWALKIIYRPVGENANVDALSRQEWFEDNIPKDILHTKEQNQASKEGANLSGGGMWGSSTQEERRGMEKNPSGTHQTLLH